VKLRFRIVDHLYNCCRAPGRLQQAEGLREMAVAWRASGKRMLGVGIRLVVLKKAYAVASSSGAMSNLGSLSPAKHLKVGLYGSPEQPPFLFLSLSQLAVRGSTEREANHAFVNRQHDAGSVPEAPQLCRHRLWLPGCCCCRPNGLGFMSAALYPLQCVMQEDISISAK
jgi:hypothetical protein